MRAQGGKLGVIELGALDLPNIPAELSRCNWGNSAGDVGLRAVQKSQVCIEEVVSLRQGSDQVQGSIPCANYGHGAGCNGRPIPSGQVFCITERLEGFDDGGPRGCSVCFEVDEQIQGLTGGRVKDAIACRTGYETCDGVLALEDIKDGVDVEGREGAGIGQGGQLMANIESSIDEGDIGFDGNGAD